MLVQTCHKRGAHALGGMSAYIPRRDDAEANELALTQVRTDKEREASQGFDGAWVAHPGLVGRCWTCSKMPSRETTSFPAYRK